jgi:leucyl aminopeptidase (aminopeptidase T)
MHLSGDWVDELSHVVKETAAGRIPALAEMQDGAVADVSVRLCYQWGWTVVRYIETSRGQAAIPRVVEQCADGDVLATLDEDPVSLERAWREWLVGFCTACPESGWQAQLR